MSINLDRILEEKFKHPFQTKRIPFEGFTVSNLFLTLKEELENLEVNENDVWICTFPKVGTTWAQEMVWLITNNVNFEKAKELLDMRSPFIDSSIVYDHREWAETHDDFKVPLCFEDSITYYKSSKSPKVVKTHLPFSLLPKEIQTGIKKPKMILVIRDSKDTCVSYYHHSILFNGFIGTFEEWCELFLAGKVCYGPYWKHVMGYWNNRHTQDILIIKYEDMKKDLISVIRQVCKFLNRSLTETQIQALTEHLSFDSMKNNPAVNKETILEFSRSLGLTGQFIRSGKVGDHKTIMSQEMKERFDEMDRKYFQETDFPLA